MDSEKRENIKWSLFLLGLVAAVFFSIILMCIGFYHVFFEEPQEPQSLPYEVRRGLTAEGAGREYWRVPYQDCIYRMYGEDDSRAWVRFVIDAAVNR